MEQVDAHTKYCSNCKKIVKKKSSKKHYNILQAKAHSEDIYENNFFKVINEPKDLTHVGFDEISNIGVKSYIRFYKLSWYEILIKFNKHNSLKDWIVDEYVLWMNKTSKRDLKLFIKSHKYISQNLIDYIGSSMIRSQAGITSWRHTDQDLHNNFRSIVNKIGYMPLFSEFVELSPIKINVYSERFNLYGTVYNDIVKMYSNEDEFNEYIKRRTKYKSETGRRIANIGKTLISLDDLEIEFKIIFDKCFKETNKYPSGRLFDKLSKYDSSTYRKKLNMRWSEVRKHYGYPSDQDKYIFENYVLKHMSKILNSEYESQKVFPWLRGVNDFPLFCDGYFEKYNLIVEVDGRQHRKSYAKFGGEKAFKTLQQNDKIKDKLIPEHGIKLLRIADNTKWHDVEYLKNRLEDVLEIKLTSSLLSAK